jgi:hypothetical protein
MSSRRYTYRVFGLDLSSNGPIPGLPPATSGDEADVLVSIGPDLPSRAGEAIRYVSQDQDGQGRPLVTIGEGPDGYRFVYADGTEFLVGADGRDVRCRWQAPLTLEDLAIYLVGPVLGWLLRLRGTVPLHASAVRTGRRAILFAGEAEAGKSTTAAAFAALGHGIMSDDIVPIHESGGDILACPGHPRVGVWPDAASALFGSPSALPRLSESYDKRYLDVRGPGYRFETRPVPIEAIYLLGARVPPGAARPARRLDPRAALMALTVHTYANHLLDSRMRARELDVLARIAMRVPVLEIAIEDRIEHLPELCRSLVTTTPVDDPACLA